MTVIPNTDNTLW